MAFSPKLNVLLSNSTSWSSKERLENMLKTAVFPKNLRPFRFHGVELDWREGEANAKADCPWCGREGKFSINVQTSEWHCWVCNEGEDKGKPIRGGNALEFIRLLWKKSADATNGESDELAKDRGLRYPDTLTHWGVVQSILTRDWLVPGWSADGKLTQLYRWLEDSKTGKRKLLPTPEMHHQLHGVNLYDKKRSKVYLTEGPWDGMALWEALRIANDREANVLAAPGCMVFFKHWLPLFAGKDVVLCYDSDHPRQGGQQAGLDGMRMVSHALAGVDKGPASVSWIRWGEQGYDPALPSGSDVRDWLTVRGPATKDALELLLAKVEPVPGDWLTGGQKVVAGAGATCASWKELTTAWRRAIKLTDGIDVALSVAIASVFSTPTVGEQLWVMMLGAASTAKTTLCEAISTSKEYTYPTDTFTRLTSGYQTDAEGSENLSLVARLHNKTLVINDGDTLLRLPNREQVLSQMRALYGRNLRAQYANKMSYNHEGINVTIVLAGTGSLMELDAAELGSRYVITDIGKITDDLEDEIGWRVANRADREMAALSDGRPETRDEPDLAAAKQLTGGYIEYLRRDPVALLAGIKSSEAALRRCQTLAKFVAFMRARPSKKQEERVERELSFRLISQHVRLAKCLAVVLNRTSLDAEVMRRVHKTAMDTAQGRTLETVRHLYVAGKKGASSGVLAVDANQTEDKQRIMLRFLRSIGVVEPFKEKTKQGVTHRAKWRLTDTIRKLYREVVGDAKD